MRAHIDESHPDTVLLAEANQWPADVVEYFGDGDECHMAFHFPVMPRMFMALRREEARPIYEILAQTPAIPDNCQWGLFLRNHDELTLEMVADEERDYMYAEYAKDPRMRINVGIRRRLAPLLDNGRDEIELVHAILFSLPGSPVLYYGDEIGMGDNVYLGDRDGVRTPMHWTGDRNAGFSRADFAQLYLPPLMDPVTGYQAVNVEAQLRSPTSLLRWLHRFIALRKEHPVFGLGTYEPLAPDNPRVFAHVRRYEEDIVLCVHNLARSAQAVTLDLSEFDGMVPEELLGGAAFPAVTRRSLPAHARAARLLLVPAEAARCLTSRACPRPSSARSSRASRGSAPHGREGAAARVVEATYVHTVAPLLAIALVEVATERGLNEIYQLPLGAAARGRAAQRRADRVARRLDGLRRALGSRARAASWSTSIRNAARRAQRRRRDRVRADGRRPTRCPCRRPRTLRRDRRGALEHARSCTARSSCSRSTACSRRATTPRSSCCAS